MPPKVIEYFPPKKVQCPACKYVAVEEEFLHKGDYIKQTAQA